MFSRLSPISLDELNREARMMTRRDRKYLLRREELLDVVELLPEHTRILQIDGRRQENYSTTYFDTPDLLCFHMTAQKRRRRFKVRQRTYVDSGLGFCEIKTLGARGMTIKRRVPIAPEYAHNGHLAREALDFLSAELGRGIVGRLGPTVQNTYVRTTLRPEGVGRVTIDTALAWSSFLGGRLANRDVVFIETKSGSQPTCVDRILWSLGHRPTCVSKFGTGMAVMHPQLPHNKWNRTINTYFLD